MPHGAPTAHDSSSTCPPDDSSREHSIRVMIVSAEIHNSGSKASDDPQDLDHVVCCSAGPLTSRNTPREADAADDADEGIWGDYCNAGSAAVTHLKHVCSFAAQAWGHIGRNCGNSGRLTGVIGLLRSSTPDLSVEDLMA